MDQTLTALPDSPEKSGQRLHVSMTSEEATCIVKMHAEVLRRELAFGFSPYDLGSGERVETIEHAATSILEWCAVLRALLDGDRSDVAGSDHDSMNRPTLPVTTGKSGEAA